MAGFGRSSTKVFDLSILNAEELVTLWKNVLQMQAKLGLLQRKRREIEQGIGIRSASQSGDKGKSNSGPESRKQSLKDSPEIVQEDKFQIVGGKKGKSQGMGKNGNLQIGRSSQSDPNKASESRFLALTVEEAEEEEPMGEILTVVIKEKDIVKEGGPPNQISLTAIGKDIKNKGGKVKNPGKKVKETINEIGKKKLMVESSTTEAALGKSKSQEGETRGIKLIHKCSQIQCLSLVEPRASVLTLQCKPSKVGPSGDPPDRKNDDMVMDKLGEESPGGVGESMDTSMENSDEEASQENFLGGDCSGDIVMGLGEDHCDQ
ncbi:hypothetical protein V2J09_010924 [Rumex salicifolius]